MKLKILFFLVSFCFFLLSNDDLNLNLNLITIPEEEDIIIEHGKGKTNHLSLNNKKKVAVWNIYKAKKENWEKDFKKILESTDLFLIQESYLTSEVISAFQTHPTYKWITAHSFSYKDIPTGVSTGSIINPTFADYIKSVHLEPVLKTPKLSLITEYKILNSPFSLLVCNVHAINFVNLSKFKTFIDQIFSAINNHNGPLILAGDFNTWSKSRLDYLLKIAEKLGLSKINFSPTLRMTEEDRLLLDLDHVFTRGLKIENAFLLNHIKSSDHKPLVFEFRFD